MSLVPCMNFSLLFCIWCGLHLTDSCFCCSQDASAVYIVKSSFCFLYIVYRLNLAISCLWCLYFVYHSHLFCCFSNCTWLSPCGILILLHYIACGALRNPLPAVFTLQVMCTSQNFCFINLHGMWFASWNPCPDVFKFQFHLANILEKFALDL